MYTVNEPPHGVVSKCWDTKDVEDDKDSSDGSKEPVVTLPAFDAVVRYEIKISAKPLAAKHLHDGLGNGDIEKIHECQHRGDVQPHRAVHQAPQLIILLVHAADLGVDNLVVFEIFCIDLPTAAAMPAALDAGTRK